MTTSRQARLVFMLVTAVAALALIVGLAAGEGRGAGQAVNGLVAAHTGSPGKAIGIEVMNPNGTGRHILPGTKGKVARSPSWSPDGTQVAYLVKNDQEDEYRLYVGGAFGGGARQLASGLRLGRPSWSPDGRRIAVWQSPGLPHVVLVPAAGGTEQRVGAGEHPAWSPDGSLIAVSFNKDLGLLHPDGSGLTDYIYTPPAGPVLVIDWSPDGAKLVFAQARHDTYYENGKDSDVFVINRDGSGLRKLASGGYPDWSPDGRKIVFQRESGIFVVDASGGTPLRLGYQLEGEPAWQRCSSTARCALPPACPLPTSLARRTFAAELQPILAKIGKERIRKAAGGVGADFLCGSASRDFLDGGRGDDVIVGRGGSDEVDGGAGADTFLMRGGARDTVDGGSGRDRGCFDALDRVRSVEIRAC